MDLLRASGGIAAAKATGAALCGPGPCRNWRGCPMFRGGERWLRWWTTRLTDTGRPPIGQPALAAIRNSCSAPAALVCGTDPIEGDRHDLASDR